jgi:hypothetical protein
MSKSNEIDENTQIRFNIPGDSNVAKAALGVVKGVRFTNIETVTLNNREMVTRARGVAATQQAIVSLEGILGHKSEPA